MRVVGRKPLCAEDKQVVVQMREAGRTVPWIVEMFGGRYTKGQIDGYLAQRNLTPEQKQHRAKKMREWRQEHGALPRPAWWATPTSPEERPPPHVLAERDRALLAPRSLTSWVLGDPAFGRSAAERRA